MSGLTARILGVALASLAALALVAAAVVLLARNDDAAPVRIIAPQPTAQMEPAAKDIRVQISGAVISPGVYSMSDGDRVMDAIAAAGGVSPDADLSAINMARRVQDEAHYHVPVVGEPGATASQSPSTDTAVPGADVSNPLIDLNTASSLELRTLPGIGPVYAERIVSHREANGSFASVDDVQDVSGIGPKTLESIRAFVTVAGEP